MPKNSNPKPRKDAGDDSSGIIDRHLETEDIYRHLEPLLEVHNIKELHDLAPKWQRSYQEELSFWGTPLEEPLRGLTPFVRATDIYYKKKYEDVWVDPVLTHLQFEDFDSVRRNWSAARKHIEEWITASDDPASSKLRTLLEEWECILLEEQNTALIEDFQEAIRQHCFVSLDNVSSFGGSASDLVRYHNNLTERAFSNLFLRLVLLAEPCEAVFLWSSERDQATKGQFYTLEETEGKLENIDSDHRLPAWLPRNEAWKSQDKLSNAEVEKIEQRLWKTYQNKSWEIETIAETPGEPGLFGIVIFVWDTENSSGRKRFQKQRLAWTMALQALVYRRAAMQQAELKGRLFSIVAHNLGSPLYHMRSDLRVLLDGFLEDSPEKRKAKYLQLLRQARHMDGIIEGILSLSDREIIVSLKKVSVARIVDEVVRTVRREARARLVQIEYRLPNSGADEDGFRIPTDENKLYDILLNLLVNAVKYSPVSGVVHVNAMSNPRGVDIRITDQGPGVPKAEIEQIFEPFYRGANSRRVSGLGLGLYVARLYTEVLKGRLTVSNESSEGATFAVFLPRLSASSRVLD